MARKHTKAKVAIYIPSHVFYANIREWEWDYEISGVITWIRRLDQTIANINLDIKTKIVSVKYIKKKMAAHSGYGVIKNFIYTFSIITTQYENKLIWIICEVWSGFYLNP